MKISVVVPAYNEQDSIPVLYSELKKVLSKYKDYEIIFVDDGSTDKSIKVMEELNKKDNRVKIIQLRKNFGKAVALTEGFKIATGDIIITMDADLQDEPEEIPRFIEKINEGCDLVNGWKYQRKDPLMKRFFSKIFNFLTSKATHVKIHDFNCGFKAYRKEVVRDLNIYGELHRYIPALVYSKGFKVCEIKVKHQKRRFGKSKYGSIRILRGFLDLITVKYLITYIQRPLHFFGSIGLILAFFGFLIGAYLSYLWAIGQVIWNRPLLLLAVLLIVLGVQFISTGLLGEMMASKEKTRDAVKRVLK